MAEQRINLDAVPPIKVRWMEEFGPHGTALAESRLTLQGESRKIGGTYARQPHETREYCEAAAEAELKSYAVGLMQRGTWAEHDAEMEHRYG